MSTPTPSGLDAGATIATGPVTCGAATALQPARSAAAVARGPRRTGTRHAAQSGPCSFVRDNASAGLTEPLLSSNDAVEFRGDGSC